MNLFSDLPMEFLKDEKFWLSISFLAFIGLLIKYALPHILRILDDQIDQITSELRDAKATKQEAEKLLVSAKKCLKDAELYAAKIVEEAEIEARRLLKEGRAATAFEMEKKLATALTKLKQEEDEMVRDMKIEAIKSAINSVAENFAQNANDNERKLLIKVAVDNLAKTIH